MEKDYHMDNTLGIQTQIFRRFIISVVDLYEISPIELVMHIRIWRISVRAENI